MGLTLDELRENHEKQRAMYADLRKSWIKWIAVFAGLSGVNLGLYLTSQDILNGIATLFCLFLVITSLVQIHRGARLINRAQQGLDSLEHHRKTNPFLISAWDYVNTNYREGEAMMLVCMPKLHRWLNEVEKEKKRSGSTSELYALIDSLAEAAGIEKREQA